ncbi:MAG TPA: ABC transporter permease [Streptosporangiaceae bacterium]|nr:ABC transporter permease [Streptosporangiaceae bacterium]
MSAITSDKAITAPTVTAPGGGLAAFKRLELFGGAALLACLIIACVAAPLIASYGPNAQDLANTLSGPTARHLLGTDDLGRDVLSRLLYGGRIDLAIGVSAVVTPFVFGSALGLLAAYLGGWVDAIVMRLLEIITAFPFYVLVIAIVFALGSGATSIYIAVSVTGWVSYTRIVRGEVLVAKRLGYAQAAEIMGYSKLRIMARHLAPNVVSQAVIFAMSDIVLTILGVVTLGYLGLGVQPPTAEWGAMIQDGAAYLPIHPLLTIIPGLAIVFTGLALSLIGDGLTEVINVR